MGCQYQSGELVPLDEMDSYVQDALDLGEFANGDTTTQWGGLRARMGHPEPFGLKYLGIGSTVCGGFTQTVPRDSYRRLFGSVGRRGSI